MFNFFKRKAIPVDEQQVAIDCAARNEADSAYRSIPFSAVGVYGDDPPGQVLREAFEDVFRAGVKLGKSLAELKPLDKEFIASNTSNKEEE